MRLTKQFLMVRLCLGTSSFGLPMAAVSVEWLVDAVRQRFAVAVGVIVGFRFCLTITYKSTSEIWLRSCKWSTAVPEKLGTFKDGIHETTRFCPFLALLADNLVQESGAPSPRR